MTTAPSDRLSLTNARKLMADELAAGCSHHTLRKTWNDVEATLNAVLARTPSPALSREVVARIIDPGIFAQPKINLYKSKYETAYSKADAILALSPAPTDKMREEVIEECARHIEHEADVATNSLHCGDNSQTIAATHRISRTYYEAAKSIRALAAAGATLSPVPTDKMREALEKIAKQKTTAEWESEFCEEFSGDYESGYDQIIATARAALGSVAAAVSADDSTEWQPIDMARLDGKPFLARYQWLGESHAMVIRRSDKGPWWIMHGTTQIVGDKGSSIQFTHWRSLPALPRDGDMMNAADDLMVGIAASADERRISLIEPIESAGMRGAAKEALADHASMFRSVTPPDYYFLDRLACVCGLPATTKPRPRGHYARKPTWRNAVSYLIPIIKQKDDEIAHLRSVLLEAVLRIEYLHAKFRPIGTGEATLARLRAALTPADGTEA